VCSHLDSTDMSYSDEPAHRSTYTVEEVARILGISRTTAYECVRRGDIQARRFGRRVVVPTIVVDRLLHSTDDLRPDHAMPGRES
jgi:excisionase family DNA binding protein